MLTFSASAFYQVIGDLQRLRGSLSNEHLIRDNKPATMKRNHIIETLFYAKLCCLNSQCCDHI